MANRKLTLDDDEKFALMKLRRNVTDILQLHHDDFFLVRWLRARSWNVEAAEKMLRDSLNWRKQWEVDGNLKTWEPPEALALYYPSGTPCVDPEGAPVIVVPFVGLDVIGLLHSVSKQDVIRLTIKILERNMQMAARNNFDKVQVIFDMEGFVLRDYAWRPAAELTISLIKMYEANYPEILKACYIVNAPRLFAIAFSVVKRFLNDYTLGKIQIFKSDRKKWQKAVREGVIDVKDLPQHYGGDLVDENGDPKCPNIVRQGGKVPRSFYTKRLNVDDVNEELTSTVIKKGRKLALDFIIPDDGYLLRWQFRTENHDIKFGVTYRDENGAVTTTVPLHRVASNKVDEVGVISCQAPTTYTITFDNSYSLMRSKKLLYNIRINNPSAQFDVNILPVEDKQLKEKINNIVM